MKIGLGLIAEKCGMTHMYCGSDGRRIAATVLLVHPHRVVQVKNLESDGYCAIQATAGSKPGHKLTDAILGHYTARGIEPGFILHEFRLTENQSYSVGDVWDMTIFHEGQYVDVTGTTIGKGFQGTVKRHNFATQDATHGNSRSHRVPGSIGCRKTPSRVFKNKRMSGHMGCITQTIQNQSILKIDVNLGLLVIAGAVPGSKSGTVFVHPSVKKPVSSLGKSYEA